MIHPLQKLNNQIKEEAETILTDYGVLDILKSHGVPHVSGSYDLNLMTWRDLDIYLAVEDISKENFFHMGLQMDAVLNPIKMSFRNELIGKTKGLPYGLYWGIYLGNERDGAWKIDIWAINKIECERLIALAKAIKEKLNSTNSLQILHIKSKCWQDPEYRRSYGSADIYKAVLENNIETIEEFFDYKNNRFL
ncbi:MAG: hypothetical protein ABI581_15160 [Sediminibacterium sp.]